MGDKQGDTDLDCKRLPRRLVRGEQPALIQQLVAGLVSTVRDVIGPVGRIEAYGLSVRLALGGSRIEIDLGYPWDTEEPTASAIEGSVAMVLSQIQTEMAEVTTEPWPARATKRRPDAHGLPEPEAQLVGISLKLRFRAGSEVIELDPIEVELK